MFGLSFGELLVVAVVGLVVLGPKELPKMLRKAGQWAGKLRRMAIDLRAQSGIDDILRAEGISDDLREITRLARGEIDGVVSAARVDGVTAAASYASTTSHDSAGTPASYAHHDPYLAPGMPAAGGIARDREYPLTGPDAYGALPETAVVYAGLLPASPLATLALYTQGIPTPVDTSLPPPPEEPAEPPAAAPSDGFSVDAFAAESASLKKAAENGALSAGAVPVPQPSGPEESLP